WMPEASRCYAVTPARRKQRGGWSRGRAGRIEWSRAKRTREELRGMSFADKTAIAGLLAVLLTAGAEPAERGSGVEVRALIVPLGAAGFDDREEASRLLGEIGAPALPALREATRSRDAEVRTRAERLVGEIQAVVNRKGREALGRRLARIRGTE